MLGIPEKQPIVGVGISTTNYGEVLRLCRHWIEQRRRAPHDSQRARYICVTSVHGTMAAFLNPALRAILNGADIATPDGMPLVWALRSFHVKNQKRVYGPNLMLALCGQAARLGHRIFLYGGREEQLGDLRRRLETRFPGLQIADAYSPPFRSLTAAEDAACVERILASGADVVFVGLSTPKQERWMADHQTRLPGRILIGVGAAFDFHAGRVRQAPHWVQQAGLEWLFRLLMEPRRLWKRYLLLTPWFLPLWALQKGGVLQYLGVVGPSRRRPGL